MATRTCDKFAGIFYYLRIFFWRTRTETDDGSTASDDDGWPSNDGWPSDDEKSTETAYVAASPNDDSCNKRKCESCYVRDEEEESGKDHVVSLDVYHRRQGDQEEWQDVERI